MVSKTLMSKSLFAPCTPTEMFYVEASHVAFMNMLPGRRAYISDSSSGIEGTYHSKEHPERWQDDCNCKAHTHAVSFMHYTHRQLKGDDTEYIEHRR